MLLGGIRNVLSLRTFGYFRFFFRNYIIKYLLLLWLLIIFLLRISWWLRWFILLIYGNILVFLIFIFCLFFFSWFLFFIVVPTLRRYLKLIFYPICCWGICCCNWYWRSRNMSSCSCFLIYWRSSWRICAICITWNNVVW